MVRKALMVGGFFSIALLAACSAAPEAPPPAAPAPAPAPSATMTTRDGVFTAAQADRGQQVFDNVCSSCHSISEWTDPGFLQTWAGVTVRDFFTQIHDTMPMDAPGSLTDQQYTDVIAYMLELNDLPVGSSELPTSEAGQRAISIQPPSGE